MRVSVIYRDGVPDARGPRITRRLQNAGLELASVTVVDVYLLSGLEEVQHRIDPAAVFTDTVAQRVLAAGEIESLDWDALIEIAYRPGVTDPVAITAAEALATASAGDLPAESGVRSARLYLLRGAPADGSDAARTSVDAEAAAALLHNPLIEQATVLSRAELGATAALPESYAAAPQTQRLPVERIDLAQLEDEALEALSRDRLLALSLPEMRAIRDYIGSQAREREESGIGRQITDVELEMVAQTWSEHCKHKIFAAKVDYEDGEHPPRTIDGLFGTYIKATTEAVAAERPFLRSVFHDDSGVIAFDEETLLCFKAETHNSPSALDPYGGAITGIVGVNRDIMGTGKGARPIFNTNVLCFGYPDTPSSELPEGLLAPKRVMEGVHHGIIDGGNQSGIPTVAGAFLFDERYTGKPLVFCGTGGILPAEIGGEPAEEKDVHPGDIAVMVGGRIGKDGIHGATFSSLALDESSPTSAVQIGDPITQRRVLDFLLQARDRRLYRGITDNGAGGLSSSLGEMAEAPGGVEIDLDACPLKYPGLAPWEILVSESQERMSLAVPNDRLSELLELASSMEVEATAVGTFTDSGYVSARAGGELVAQIRTAFLHDGVPQMRIPARWSPPRGSTSGRGATGAEPIGVAEESPPADDTLASVDLREAMLALLAEPNIASKEHLIRQYDHEVQGGSVVKPFQGVCADAPSDGAVITPRYDSDRGVTVTHGVCPRYGDVDTYQMAACAVDEAMRAHVALGGDPAFAAALDNFCWPDPVESVQTPDGRYKMAQLVRACEGLADTCRAYRLPLISGKDSMKNDARFGERKVSIRPTLLVSLMGVIPDVRLATGSDFLAAGDEILLVGRFRPRAGGSSLERLLLRSGLFDGWDPTTDPSFATCPEVDAAANLATYQALYEAIHAGLIRSCHDLSDGGLGIALAESAIGGRLGAQITLPTVDGRELDSLALFGESAGCFVVSCEAEDVAHLQASLPAGCVQRLGVVTEKSVLTVTTYEQLTVSWRLPALIKAWNAFAASSGDECANLVRTPQPATPAGAAILPTPSAHIREEHTAAANRPTVAGSDSPQRAASPPGIGKAPRAIVLSGYGINAELELARAFELGGANPEIVHLSRLLEEPRRLAEYSILALPGGFSYGDHLGSGLILAHLLRERLGEEMWAFARAGKLMLGICNGFQVLTKAGLLPGDNQRAQSSTLVHNEHGMFEDSWVTIGPAADNRSPWIEGLEPIECPIRHGEGRFSAPQATVARIQERSQVAFRYLDRNPNGSLDSIAGITDETGQILGMMPHPEAFLRPENHPHRRRGTHQPPLRLFQNAVRALR